LGAAEQSDEGKNDVDDIKISHKKAEVVTSIMRLFKLEFGGPDAPITRKRSKVFDYLGMTLDYLSPGQVTISMIKYIEDMLEDLPTDMEGESVTTAANHLFR
jgi:hypothetical protein